MNPLRSHLSGVAQCRRVDEDVAPVGPLRQQLALARADAHHQDVQLGHAYDLPRAEGFALKMHQKLAEEDGVTLREPPHVGDDALVHLDA